MVSPLQNILTVVLATTRPKRTKAAAKRVQLDACGWSEATDIALQQFKNALANACTLAHPSEDAELCLFTDASDFF